MQAGVLEVVVQGEVLVAEGHDEGGPDCQQGEHGQAGARGATPEECRRREAECGALAKHHPPLPALQSQRGARDRGQ